VDKLIAQVTLLGFGSIVVVAAAAAGIAGAPAAVGAAAGGLVTLLNFQLLGRAASRLLVAPRPGLALIGAACRYAVTFAMLALLCSTGWADPVAIVVGLSVLPPILIAQGLRSR
jgi:hypothetical protein